MRSYKRYWLGIVAAVAVVGCGGTESAELIEDRPNSAFQDSIGALESGEFPPQHALLIWQNGEVALEKYWNGPDLVYGERRDREFGPDELHGTRSCSKSVVSLLVGIAIGEGLLPTVDTSAYTLFPDLALDQQPKFTEAHRAITLEHLLTMRAGLDWVDATNERELEESTDVAAYVWSQPMQDVPGARFNYCSGATALLSRAVGRAFGNDVEKYAAEKLFAPLGITKWEWLRDQDREPAGHFGLRLRPRDMLKIGRLVLQDGIWDGNQVVPASWIDKLSDHRNRTRKYGYQWWLKEFHVGDHVSSAINAYGKGGQTIFVLPDEDAVVVLTAGHYNDNDAASARDLFLEKKILPELISRRID